MRTNTLAFLVWHNFHRCFHTSHEARLALQWGELFKLIGALLHVFLQVLRLNSISTGRISRRPSSMVSVSTTLEKAL